MPAAIALAVGTAATLSPQALLRPFGIAPADLTPAGELGWRLFGVRTAVVGGAALAGHPAAVAMIGPVQIPDQAVFAAALRRGALPRRAALLAMAVSGAIAAADVARRRRGNPV